MGCWVWLYKSMGVLLRTSTKTIRLQYTSQSLFVDPLGFFASLLIHRSRWQMTWRQVLECTDWLSLESEEQVQMQLHVPSGDISVVLMSTPLYRGVRACCGKGAFGYGTYLTDSGPVSEVRGWLQEWTSGGKRAAALVLLAFDSAIQSHERDVEEEKRAAASFGLYRSLTQNDSTL